MKTQNLLAYFGLNLLLLTTTANSAAAVSLYRLTDLGKLNPDGTDTRANGLNNQGQIVGRSRIGSGTPSHGFIWENNTLTELPFSGPRNGDPNDIVILPGRGGFSRSINEQGFIVGTADETTGPTDRALLWSPNGSGGYDLVIYDFGGIESYFIDINNSEQIAGYHIFATGKRNAIFWENNVRIDLPNLGGDQNFGIGINDQTQIVGYVDADGADNDTNTYTAALWEKDSNGNFVLNNLGTFGATQSFARDVNSLGDIVGQTTIGSGNTVTSSSPVFWDNGNFTNLGSLGGTRGDALSINRHQQIVGVSNTPSEVGAAFLWQEGQIYNLNNLLTNGTGWELRQANAINDRGQIVGFGIFTNSSGQQETRAFLLETVPEASTVWGLLGLSTLGIMQLKTKKK